MLIYVGRVQLVKNVTFPIANYGMKCFPLPKHVIHKIDFIYRSFVWTGGFIISIKSPNTWK